MNKRPTRDEITAHREWDSDDIATSFDESAQLVSAK